MAVELCQDSLSSGMSPRISFSHDLCLSENTVLIEQHPFRSSSSGSVDFDFCTRKSFDQDSSSADELFSDGKILPTEVKKKATNPAKQKERPSSSFKPHRARVLDDDVGFEQEKESSNKSSFWRFKRSNSLNCGNGYGRTLCPLPLLSRSNSTGSTPGVKRSTVSKDSTNYNQKQNHKQGSVNGSSSSSSSSSSSNHQKPPLKKNYGNGVRVAPVINVPSGNLFGLRSILFNNGKDKSIKKR